MCTPLTAPPTVGFQVASGGVNARPSIVPPGRPAKVYTPVASVVAVALLPNTTSRPASASLSARIACLLRPSAASWSRTASSSTRAARAIPARQLAGLIDRWKNKGWTPADIDAGESEAFANGRGGELYAQYQARLKKHQQEGKRDPELALYRWMLEELRVSFFAQELRTPYPVSAKRLDKVWAQLQQ